MEYDRRFLKGISEFDRGLFYRAHETWEELWLADRGSERGFYQGLIQLAAAYFKWEQEVPRGALKLLRSAVPKLELYRPLCLGVNVYPHPTLELPSDSPRGKARPNVNSSSGHRSVRFPILRLCFGDVAPGYALLDTQNRDPDLFDCAHCQHLDRGVSDWRDSPSGFRGRLCLHRGRHAAAHYPPMYLHRGAEGWGSP